MKTKPTLNIYYKPSTKNNQSPWIGQTRFTVVYQLPGNYAKSYVDITMPGYVNAALHNFSRPQPTCPKDAPYNCTQPMYIAKIQYAKAPNSAKPLPKPAVTCIQ